MTLRERYWWLWRRREGRRSGLSPLMLRILAVNVMPLAILVGSLLYLGRYQERLIAAETDALFLQARLSASAIGEGAVVVDEDDQSILSPLLARLMIRRLVEATGTRTRLYDLDNTLLADSRILLEHSGKVQVKRLPASSGGFGITRAAMAFFDGLDTLLERQTFDIYDEEKAQNGDQYDIVRKAIDGDAASQVWRLPEGGLLIAVAVPVQRYKQVLGSVMLSRPDTKVNAAIRSVRLNILEIFGITLLITVLLSLYLARAIARPLRLLSMAAEKLHHGQRKNVGLAGTAKLLTPETIPDFSLRHDEIGDLSIALRDMTGALGQRIGAIENFAADVAHEIKNPLTSLRSAVETAERVQDPAQQRRLMLVIRDDVDRLDRLISDISNASRLDAELSRDEIETIDVAKMLGMLVDFYAVGDDVNASTAPAVVLEPLPEGPLAVMGVEVRIVQVLQNLISNALSFSPPGGKVRIGVRFEKGFLVLSVEDDGPGIPENKAQALFDRFYTERPKSEKFGTHSGLGLSISKQIIEAHRGKIWAENRKDDDGRVVGARFVVMLPLG
jgi:two-component system sensor histidine kinase ChvG